MKKTLTFLFVALFASVFVLAQARSARANGAQTFVVSVDNVGVFPLKSAGVFNTPVGAAAPGPVGPGSNGAYSFVFNGAPGERLSLATMFVQSNDWFYAPDERGIPLYDAAGAPIEGDVTKYIQLWDAGTEIDQPVGIGADQAPRQSGADTGAADTDNRVRQVLTPVVPATADAIQVSLEYIDFQTFRATITNVAGADQPVVLAPGVYVVHTTPAPLFINGQPDFGQGLEAIAEDGNPAGLNANLNARVGVTTPLAPVAFGVHQQANALFTAGAAASAGLEALAEDGGPGALVAELELAQKGAAAIGRGQSAPGPIFPTGGNYQFTITAVPGDHLSLASMFVQSNDWFFSVNNLPLFDGNGNPIVGDITHHIGLYDAGTEVDEAAGYGANQAPRQSGPNTGADQNGVVTLLGTGGNGNVRINITPINP